jgi:hypothetical protein
VVEMAKLWAEPEEVTSILKPTEVEVVKVWAAAVKPFREVMAPEASAQFDQATPEAEVEEATKHKPLDPTVWMPKVPEPVPVIRPPLAIPEASKPKAPWEGDQMPVTAEVAMAMLVLVTETIWP